MADPLRHKCKLDIAEEILDFIRDSPDAEDIRAVIRNILELTDADLEDAHSVVENLRDLIDEQQF